MASIDLKDTYLQIPVHPDSRQFLRFVAFGVSHQFRALCLGPSTALQFFTRVMVPVSAMLHRWGIQMFRYLDDWLVLASSRTDALWVRDEVLSLCRDLGIVINLPKSRLVPTQSAPIWECTVHGVSNLRAFPSQERVSALLTQMEGFLSCKRQGVVS